MWALLGGCNCKVPSEVCERLVALVFRLWERCRNQTLEVIQSNSVVERAAFYLSQAVQSSAEDDCLFGPDSPHVSLACKEQAALLLLDLLAQGGRLKKRALRGILPQLAGRRGSGGFFHRTQAAAAARTLGELVAKNAVDDPQLVDDPEEVTHLLLAIQQMVQEDTGDTKADLTEWKGSRYCVILLEVVSKVLEQKLLKDRELERGAYEAAFKEGQGLEIMVPLIRANPEVALHALRCVCTMAQTYLENVELIIRLGTIQALLNLESASMASMMETLKIPDGRRYAARILMQCSASKDFMDVIGTQQERSFTLQLVKLGIQLWDDGISSAEAFQDIMHVFHAIAVGPRPDILSRHLRETEMLQLLLRLEKNLGVPSSPLAAEILKTLRKDRDFKRAFAPVKRLYDEGYDPDLELKLRQQSSAMPN